jgi:hypothetical protein
MARESSHEPQTSLTAGIMALGNTSLKSHILLREELYPVGCLLDLLAIVIIFVDLYLYVIDR